MASVFLSYDHGDAKTARPIVDALQKAGHVVWWDQHMQGGAEYNSEIETAVDRSDIVVVLWSKRAVKSAWVRDEAAEGRDTGKLIPVSLDGTKPPMGFRQYQTIDLSSSRGQRSKKFEELLGAVGKQPRQAPNHDTSGGLSKRVRRDRLTLVWIAALLIMGAAALWAIQKGQAPGRSQVIAAVVPAGESIASRDLARDVLAKLGQFQATSGSNVELVSPERRKDANFVFEVGGSAVGQQVRSTIVLSNGSNGRLLWSKSLEQPSRSAADLTPQVAVSVAAALRCAVGTYSAGKVVLGRDDLGAYLKACVDLQDRRYGSVADLVPIFRKSVVGAPRFTAGWSNLLLAEFSAVANAPDSQTGDRLRLDLKRDISAARKTSPHLPASYQAELITVPPTDISGAIALLERGIAHNPDDSLLLSLRSDQLHSVGRLNDSVADARRALELDSISPTVRERYVYTLAGSGRIQAALEQLAEADKLWPGSPVLQQVRLIVYNRYGDPRQALQMLRSRGIQTPSGAADSFLQARINPIPINVARAIAEAQSAYRQSPVGIVHLIQVLNEYDRQDELLALMASLPIGDQADYAELFFRPAAHEFWKDPRSLLYARRVGLLRYWTSSGKWPDFCFESDWPYDCKAEGAKIS